MSEQLPPDPHQQLNISNDAAVKNSQIGGLAGRDMTVAQNQGSGNIFQDVTLNVFNSQTKSKRAGLTRQEYRNRQALLKKVTHYWVKGVLKTSLPNQVLIVLGLEDRPDTVAHPWNLVLETPNELQKPLPKGTKVIDIFDSIGEGRTLLILGEPGSGKTTTLLELTRDLVSRAEQDVNHLIPVVFNLSSWEGEKQTIADWLVEELNTKYQVPKKIGQTWVKRQQLLLLLDGLDEVRAKYQEACITALNAFHQEYSPEIVVCSRYKEYEALSNRLNFQSAICLRSLNLEQVHYYLDSVSSNFGGLRTLIDKDVPLQELAKSPLMLNIITLAYQGVSVEDLPKTDLLEERQKQLFDAYIEKMFSRPNRSNGDWRYLNSKYQAKLWLILLAQRIKQESQTIFLIERMQPTWLQTSIQRWIYNISIGLIAMVSLLLILELNFLLILGQGYPLKFGLFLLLVGGLIIILGLAQGDIPGIKPVENLQWSWIKFTNVLRIATSVAGIAQLQEFEDSNEAREPSRQGNQKIIQHRHFLKSLSIIGIVFPIFIYEYIFFPSRLLILKLSLLLFFLPYKAKNKLLSLVTLVAQLEILDILNIVYFFPIFVIVIIVILARKILSLIPSKCKKNLFALVAQAARLALFLMWVRGLWLLVTNPNKAVQIVMYIIQNIVTVLTPLLPRGIPFILLFMLIIGLFSGLTISEIEKTTNSNQGIWNSAINAGILTLIFGLPCGFVVGLIFELYKGLICGLGIGLIVGLWSGRACAQHFILRIILWWSRLTPWNYARFLNYATERIFLQQVGGGYIFIHRLLMEHFAQMKLERVRD